MKLLGLEVRKLSKADKDLPNQSRDAGQRYILSELSVKQQLMNNTVASCAFLLADTIGQLSCHVYKHDDYGRKRDTTSSLSYVLEKSPNFYDVPFTFKNTIVLHLALKGNAFIFIGRNSDYSVKSLTPLDPDLVDIKYDTQGDIYYEYRYNGKIYKYTSEHILHIPAYRYNTIRGLSPIQYAYLCVQLGVELEEYTFDQFDGGIQNKLMVKVPKEERNWTKEDSKKLKERIMSNYGGKENRTSPLILSKGLEATPLNLATNADAQLSENRIFSEKEVAKIYRIPLYMLGKDDSKFTNQEQAASFFLQNTLSPWLVRIQQYLSKLLVYPYKNDYYVEFDPSTLLRADYKTRIEGEIKGLHGGLYTPNQVLDMENLPRIKDDYGDKHFMPVNISTMDKIAQQTVEEAKSNKTQQEKE